MHLLQGYNEGYSSLLCVWHKGSPAVCMQAGRFLTSDACACGVSAWGSGAEPLLSPCTLHLCAVTQFVHCPVASRVVASTLRYEYTGLAMAMGPQDFWMCLATAPQHYTHQHVEAQQLPARYFAAPVPKLKQHIALSYTAHCLRPSHIARGPAEARLRGALGP
jgi:hypothetical protein